MRGLVGNRVSFFGSERGIYLILTHYDAAMDIALWGRVGKSVPDSLYISTTLVACMVVRLVGVFLGVVRE